MTYKSSINNKQSSVKSVKSMEVKTEQASIMINTDLLNNPQLYRSYNNLDAVKQKKSSIEIFDNFYDKFKVFLNVSVGNKKIYKINISENVLNSIPKKIDIK